MTSLIKAFAPTFPSSCEDVELDLPSLFALKPVPVALIPELKEFISEESIPDDVIEYLQDVTFIALPQSPTTFARLFDEAYEGEDRDRQGRRLKAEMLLVNDKSSCNQIVSLDSLTGTTKSNDGLDPVPTSIEMVSPAFSYSSLTNDTDAESEYETMTPDLGNSQMFERVGVKSGSKSRSPSLEQRDQVKGGNAPAMGLGFDTLPASLG
jgi:hypothetical protein